MESVDLLGMDFVPVRPSTPPPQPVVLQTPSPEQQATSGYPNQEKRHEVKVQDNVEAQASVVAQPVNRQRKFNVRCEGRWRVRSEASLSAKVVGTVANGTTVVPIDDCVIEPNTLWIQVSHFEANKPGGTSEMKCDVGTGSQMWCLRRNALGYGLYEIGVESMDELKGLSESLSQELRATTLAGISESTEEVSTTWKLLETAQNVSNFFSAWTPGASAKENGSVTKIDNKKEKADALFEKRQREQVQSTAKNLRLNIEKLVGTDLETLPFNLRCRLESIFQVLIKAEYMKTTKATTPPVTAPNEQLSLQRLMELCTKVERNGNLASNVRQEFSSLVNPVLADLEAQAKRLRLQEPPRSAGPRPRTESDKENTENQETTQDGSPRKAPQSQQPLRVPLLPPPPRSSNGIANAQLIF